MTNIATVYDSIAENYFSDNHLTTKFLYLIQDFFMSNAVLSVKKYNPKLLKDMNVLVAGAGSTGNSRQTTGVLDKLRGIEDSSLDCEKITYLDISKGALASLSHGHYEAISKHGLGTHIPGKFVQGDARELCDLFGENAFDIVLAGLCDHIEPWQLFFKEVYLVLRENGAFITTYPAKEIFKTIRENIYRIPSNKTRFKNGENTFILESVIVDVNELKEMYESFCFRHVQTTNINHSDKYVEEQPFLRAQNYAPSPTIVKAATIIGKPLEEIPVLTGGLGFK